MNTIRKLQFFFAALILSLSFNTQAQAQFEDFTPVGGWYWKVLEGGTGINLEIQDNVVILSVYAYDFLGIPFWYVAGGELEGNNYFSGPLVEAEGGQCIGCEWTQPVLFDSTQGNITLEWTSKNTILVTMGGETNLFERQLFAPAMLDPLTYMLGEWKIVMDFDGAGLNFPFLADILTFDSIFDDGIIEQFEGYRNHTADPAAGNYDDEFDLYQIVVAESANTNLLLFDIDADTNSFTAIAEFYDPAVGPDFSGFVVEGFRSASASYVQTTFGPSKTATPSAGIGLKREMQLKSLVGKVSSKTADAARIRLQEMVAQLEQRIKQKTAK